MALKANKTAVAIMKQPTLDTFVPSVSTDLYPVANLSLSIEGITAENPEYTGTIHKNGAEVVGKQVSISFQMLMRPPVGGLPLADVYIPGRVLQAAKFTENRFATGISAEALGVGSTTTMAKLGATAAATDGLYKGLLVSLGAGSYGSKLYGIRSYNVSKEATLTELLGSAPTGNYEIRPQLAYQRSVSDVDPTKLCLEVWLDGLRYDLFNLVVSSLRWSIPTATNQATDFPVFEVTLTGNLYATEDEATPTIAALGAIPKFRDGDLWVANKAVGGSSLSLDFGLRSAYPPNPNKPEGVDGGELVESITSVSLDLQKYRKADFDTLAMADAQAQHPLFARWGGVSGATVAIVVPDFRFNYQSPNLGTDFVNETGDLFVDVFDRNVSIVFPY